MNMGGSYWVFGHAGIHKQNQDKRKLWIIMALTNFFSKYAKKRSDWQLWAAQRCCTHTFNLNSGAPQVSATSGVTPSLFYTARLLSRMTAPTPGKAPVPLFCTSATEWQSLMSRQGTHLLCWAQENHCLFSFHTQSRQSQSELPSAGFSAQNGSCMWPEDHRALLVRTWTPECTLTPPATPLHGHAM